MSIEERSPLVGYQPQTDDSFLDEANDDRQQEARILRKVDRRMSILVIIYVLNYIDRNAASAARLRGFEEDLNLSGNQFASILSILYVGYLIMQVPSNMLLCYLGRPSLYLPICMAVWGLLSFLTGFTTNFIGALIIRFWLGFVEAAFFPGALFLISKWYTRKELSQRTALLSCGSLISNAFGALISSAILDGMEGVFGFAAWRWLFFIEGAITVIVAILALRILPDFPETSSWLSRAEQQLMLRRLAEESHTYVGRDTKDLSSQIEGFWLAIGDWKVWYLSITLTMLVAALSFNAYFPTLASVSLGTDRKTTLLLCAPPWIVATGLAFVWTRHSDLHQERTYHVLLSFAIGIVGFVLGGLTTNVFTRYLSLFFMAQSYSGFIVFLSWASGTFPHPPAKRAVGLALMNTISSLGNVFGSYFWPVEFGPSYAKSYMICIFFAVVGGIMCLAFRWKLHAHNKEAEAHEAAQGNPKGFRYLL
ncbi:major facilitator superfamily domain-containing protein [Flagelloscypha sp. PMI_526]|nr:major facilitator superfamily domain-containing protein [Flagelloscypha sp. PMI_526]